MKREARRKERQSKKQNSEHSQNDGVTTDRLTWFGTKLDQSNNSNKAAAASSLSLESAIKPQVGKYMNKVDSNSKKRIDDRSMSSTDLKPPNPKKQKSAASGGFGDFSAW